MTDVDHEIGDIEAAGLEVQCIVRFKLFTLDNRLLLRKIGRLGQDDWGRVEREMGEFALRSTSSPSPP